MSFDHINTDNDGKLVASRAPMDYNTRRRFGRRLVRLHAYLKTIPAKQYNHSHLADKVVKDRPCGAVACAFGHAVVSGRFPDINASFRAKFDSKGIAFLDGGRTIDESSIRFVTTKNADTVKSLSAVLKGDFNGYGYGRSLRPSDIEDEMNFPADAFFGPGAWDVIFDQDAYGWNTGKVAKATVLKRIADVAEKVYGVKVPA